MKEKPNLRNESRYAPERATSKENGLRFLFMISFSKKQGELAHTLDEELTIRDEEDEFLDRCIIYNRDFMVKGDEDFVLQITKSIVNSDYVIALVSNDYLKSNWCRKEFITAHNAGKLIPVLVEECDTDLLPIEDTDSIIDARSLPIDKIIAAIQSRIGNTQENNPNILEENEIYEFIERAVVVLPRFSGTYGVERWQHRTAGYIGALLKKDNVIVKTTNEVASSLEEAEQIRLKLNADIVFYGNVGQKNIDLGFTSQGWEYKHNTVHLQLPENKLLKARRNNKGDFVQILKLSLANFETGRNRHEKAQHNFDEALGFGKDSWRAENAGTEYVKLFYGVSLFEAGKFTEAIEQLTECLEIDEENDLGWYYLGNCNNELGNINKALGNYNKAISLNNLNHWAWNNRGVMYYKSGKYQNAINDVSKAINLSPNYFDYWHNRGVFNYKLGKFKESIFDLTKAIQLNKRKYASWAQLGSSHEADGNYQEALFNIEQAIKLDDNIYIRIFQGYCYKVLENFEEALKSYENAIKINPSDWRAYFHIGKMYVELKNWCKAQKYLSKAVSLGENRQSLLDLLSEAENRCGED